MLGPLKYKLITSAVLGLGTIGGICGFEAREYMSSKRSKELQSSIDKRIKPSTKEGLFLKMTRLINILAVRYSMQYVCHVRNKTHHYNLGNLYSAINRPDNVGLLTVCNHVSVLDSASIVPSIVPLSQINCPRNCGYWNLGAEEIMFDTLPKSMICSLIKIMPINRDGGVNQIELANFTQRAKYGDWDQLSCCRDAEGRRCRDSGRAAPPGRDLGPLKWGVGKVVYDVIVSDTDSNSKFSFENGVNNGKLIVLPYYHLNMEKVMPQDSDRHLITIIPKKNIDIYCSFGNPIDFSDIIPQYYSRLQTIESLEEKQNVQYELYKEITDRIEDSLEHLEYFLKDIRKRELYV